LGLDSNQLTSIDVSQNLALTSLGLDSNQLTSIDVSQNIALEELECADNQLSNLDVSQNTTLTDLNCSSNQLTSLDLRNGNNMSINSLLCTNNPNLYCINVDDSLYSTTNWIAANWYIFLDSQSYFSNNCPPPSAIQEHSANKKLLGIIDVLGRETKNKPLFYIYDDGTVEKRLTIE
jgi:Leucine-rich repeat (LRR) protein